MWQDCLWSLKIFFFSFQILIYGASHLFWWMLIENLIRDRGQGCEYHSICVCLWVFCCSFYSFDYLCLFVCFFFFVYYPPYYSKSLISWKIRETVLYPYGKKLMISCCQVSLLSKEKTVSNPVHYFQKVPLSLQRVPLLQVFKKNGKNFTFFLKVVKYVCVRLWMTKLWFWNIH